MSKKKSHKKRQNKEPIINLITALIYLTVGILTIVEKLLDRLK